MDYRPYIKFKRPCQTQQTFQSYTAASIVALSVRFHSVSFHINRKPKLFSLPKVSPKLHEKVPSAISPCCTCSLRWDSSVGILFVCGILSHSVRRTDKISSHSPTVAYSFTSFLYLYAVFLSSTWIFDRKSPWPCDRRPTNQPTTACVSLIR